MFVFSKLAFDQWLPGNIKVVGDNETSKDCTNLLNLKRHASRFASSMVDIHTICIFGHIERALQDDK